MEFQEAAEVLQAQQLELPQVAQVEMEWLAAAAAEQLQQLVLELAVKVEMDLILLQAKQQLEAQVLLELTQQEAQAEVLEQHKMDLMPLGLQEEMVVSAAVVVAGVLMAEHKQ
jgi:hypothetical protein